MKLLLIAAVVLVVTALVTEAHRGHRNHKNRKGSKSSNSKGPRHDTLNGCLHICQKSQVLREKLINELCPDPCEGITCSGRGTCYLGRCNCLPEFTGCECQNEIDPCENVNCQNNGTCVNGNCDCVPGFAGPLCTEDLRCDNVTCNNNGTCVAGGCNCTTEFLGDRCDTNCNTVRVIPPENRRKMRPRISGFETAKLRHTNISDKYVRVRDGTGQSTCPCRRIPGMEGATLALILTTRNDIDECEAFCFETADCISYDYTSTFGSFECWLYDVDISISAIAVAGPDTTAGICTATACP